MKKLQTFLLRPRYLRAIPSLVVLTTAMAWSVAPDGDAAEAQQKKYGTAISQADERPALPVPTLKATLDPSA